MKNILIFILTLLSFGLFAQTDYILQKDGKKLFGTAVGEVPVWDGTSWVTQELTASDVAVVRDSSEFGLYNGAAKVIIMEDVNRGGKFKRCVTCTADNYMVFTDANSQKWERFDYDAVRPEWFGAIPDNASNDHFAVQSALNYTGRNNVSFSKGQYRVKELNIPANKVINGNGASFIQESNCANTCPVFTVTGQNVTINDINIYGQIATQAGEWSAGINASNQATYEVDKLTINNVSVYNVRGDGIYIGSNNITTSTTPDNISISNVYIDNAYRNGVSIISGTNIDITNLEAYRVGLTSIDLEGDDVSHFCNNVRMSGIKGGPIFISKAMVGRQNENITLENFDLDFSKYQNSTPAYFARQQDLIALRGVKNFVVKNGRLANAERSAIWFPAGDNTASDIFFENVNIDTCATSVAAVRVISYDQLPTSKIVFKECNFRGNNEPQIYEGGPETVFENCYFQDFSRISYGAGKQIFSNLKVSNINYIDPLPAVSSEKFITNTNTTFNTSLFTGDNVFKVYVENTNISPKYFPISAIGPRISLRGNNFLNGITYKRATGSEPENINFVNNTASNSTIYVPVQFAVDGNIYNIIDSLGAQYYLDGIGNKIDGSLTPILHSGSKSLLFSNGQWSTLSEKKTNAALDGSGIELSASGKINWNGTLDQNTVINGSGTNQLSFLNISGGTLFNNPIRYAEGTGIALRADLTSNPSTGDESFFGVTGGGTGLYAGYGNVVIRPRPGQNINLSCDGTTSHLLVESTGITEVNLAGSGTRVMTVDANGKHGATIPVSEIGKKLRSEPFTATASQTAFTITYTAPAQTGTEMPLMVTRNGVLLEYTSGVPTVTEFTYSGTTVTTSANTAGDKITIRYLN